MAIPRLPTNVKATWAGTGVGDFSSLSAASGFVLPGAAQDTLILVYEAINIDQMTQGLSSERELGFGQWNNGTGVLSRADGPGSVTQVGVIGGTNGTNRQNFSAGTKLISILPVTELMEAIFATVSGAQTLTEKILKDYSETAPAVGGISGSVSRDFRDGAVQELTLTGNVTPPLVITNPPASGEAGSITFVIDHGTGPFTWAHPTGTVWAGGITPTLSDGANEVSIVTYVTRDGGTTWYGFLGGENFS